jgi:hypothetical protein
MSDTRPAEKPRFPAPSGRPTPSNCSNDRYSSMPRSWSSSEGNLGMSPAGGPSSTAVLWGRSIFCRSIPGRSPIDTDIKTPSRWPRS